MKITKSVFVLAILLTLTLTSKSQIILEHVYDSAATGAGQHWCSITFSQLMLIDFEISGKRYVNINRCGKVIEIYDLSHTLVKTISLASLPPDINYSTIGDILYLSQRLFSTDSKIAFMYLFQENDSLGDSYSVTNIYNEDATLMFSDTSGAWVYPSYEMQQWPIFNTTGGTKMILSDQGSGHAKVFSLPGTLSTCCALANNVQLIQAQGGRLFNLYPNPNNGSVTLQFELPKGEKEGEIVLYNTIGIEIKRYKVDGALKELVIDNTQLAAGAYFYQLQTSKGAADKKMIIVK